MTTISIHILRTNGQAALGKLADAEIHFNGGELDGLKLVGFAVWKSRDGQGEDVSFPSRQFVVHGERRSFSLLRWAELRTWCGKPTSSTRDPQTRAPGTRSSAMWPARA
jgi:hypothetical protein